MTKFERLSLQKNKAASLHSQGRWAEARLKYEKIIDELLKPFAPKATKK